MEYPVTRVLWSSDNGKILLRASGTEPVVRIMIEYSDINLCKEYAEKIKSVMVERGYVNA